MGIVSAVEAVPHVSPNVAMAMGQVEELEYSLYVTGKESELTLQALKSCLKYTLRLRLELTRS